MTAPTARQPLLDVVGLRVTYGGSWPSPTSTCRSPRVVSMG